MVEFFFLELHLEGGLKACCLGTPGKGVRTRGSPRGSEVWEGCCLLKEQHSEGSAALGGKRGHI